MAVDRRPLDLPEGEVLSLTAPGGGSAFFEITRQLGAGGAGVIYEAIDDDGNTAIVKGPRTVGEGGAEMRRERNELERHDHPNLLKLLGFQEDPRGHLLLCLERLFENPLMWLHTLAKQPGGPPDSGLSEPGVPAATALTLTYELALALQYLHGCGLTHMDVKPHNLMMAIDWPSGDPSPADYLERLVEGRWRGVLIDLGGLLSREDVRALNARKSRVDPQLTPVYAPPEILPGLDEPGGRVRRIFGQAADIYAVGLTLTTLLTGQAPYAHLGRAPRGGSFEEVGNVKRAERRGELRAYDAGLLDRIDLSDTALRCSQDELRRELRGFVEIITHLDPRRRGTADRLVERLGALLGVRPVSLPDARALRRCHKESERTIRRYTTERVFLDPRRNRFTDSIQRLRGPKTRKPGQTRILKGGKDFWEQLGM